MQSRQLPRPAPGPGFSGPLWCLLAMAALGLGSLLPAAGPVTPYGNNSAAGHTTTLNGIRLYFEIYGAGAPLVVLHGNGGSISALDHQIDFFRSHRQVIAIDSRGHGRSGMGPGRLTYEQMAADVAALLAQLQTGPADVLGWSDGGIVTLLLALHHPAAVRRIALSGANLSPDDLAPGDLAGLTADLRTAREKLAAGDRSRPWDIVGQQLQLMVTQPHITAADLARITAPALVLAGEHDIISAEHTRRIAAGLPHAELHIFPGAGHGALQEVPEAFNAIVEQFFAAPR
jgi:pimeloyl-ACP methyl ester carboxylesterase